MASISLNSTPEMYNTFNNNITEYLLHISSKNYGYYILAIIIFIFLLFFTYLNINNKTPMAKKDNTSKSMFFINTVLLFLIFVIVILNITKYYFGIDVKSSMSSNDVILDINKN